MGSILSGTMIKKAVETGQIVIEPFDPAQVNPVSYDVTLGSTVAVYAGWVEPFTRGHHGGKPLPEDGRHFTKLTRVHDVKQEPQVHLFEIGPDGWVLRPGVGYLMHTRERIRTDLYVPILDGKSSIGRLFIAIHVTAGFGDPGFDGQYTLEVQVMHPVRVYAGMRIGQMRFQTIEGPVDSYQKSGRYTGRFAKGPVASQAWRMFGKGPQAMKPLPEGVRYTNGGKECDMLEGPCACGAWHHEGEKRGLT